MKTFEIITIVTVKDDLVNEHNLAEFVSEAIEKQVLLEGDTLEDITVSLLDTSE